MNRKQFLTAALLVLTVVVVLGTMIAVFWHGAPMQ